MSDRANTELTTRAGMRILLTNNTLASRAGSELYLRDLAIEFVKRGHFPVAYSPLLGDVANELRNATIPVIDDLSDLAQPPDIIHGQHHLETMTAVLRFPQVPAIYICHGWLPWEELPPSFTTISEYVAVDDLCRERLLTTKGVVPDNVSVIRNFVDTERFLQRSEWSARPRSALIFSNATRADDARALAIKSACAQIGIDRVDIFGEAAGQSHPEPERVLGRYDIIFAKARCAIEAMASGAAVIVTDFAGLAGMVTFDRFASMRSLNFGARTMQAKMITTDNILSELRCYDADDVQRVSNLMRAEGSLTSAANEWISLYGRVIGRHDRSDRSELPPAALQGMNDASRYLAFLAPVIKTRVAAEAASRAAEQRASEASQRSSSLQDELEASVRTGQAWAAEHESIVAALTARRNELESELHAQRVAREQDVIGLSRQIEALTDEMTISLSACQDELLRLRAEAIEHAAELEAHRLAHDQDAIRIASLENARHRLLRQVESLTSGMAATILSRDSEFAGSRADAGREYAQLQTQLATARDQLDAIQSSRAWKAVQRYGKLKRWLRI